MKTYGPSRSRAAAVPIAWQPRIGPALKLGAIGLAMLIGLALTLAAAEASGDPYGDAYDATGNIDGMLTNVIGEADTSIVQIGADGAGGSLVVVFTDNVVFDGPGPDIRVHTLDLIDPAEATIEVSDDGLTFVSAGNFFDDTGPIDIDLGALGLSYATTVRLTYVSGILPGFDLDAVEGLNQLGLDGASVSLAPAANADPGFSEYQVVATVTDSVEGGDIPIEGIPVTFVVVSGPSTGVTGVGSTNAAGEATFGWIGTATGVDEIVAWLDLDGSGTIDEGEASGDATKLWFGDTGTIALTDLDGGDVALDDLIEVAVEDRDLDATDGVDTVDVLLTSSSAPSGIIVTLSETGPRTGRFTAVISLTEVLDDAIQALDATVGDIVTGSYDDALDETGADPAAVTASLEVVADIEADLASEAIEDGHATVCHLPGGDMDKRRTLVVGESALDAHLAHGDVEGDCADVVLDADQDEQPSKYEHAEERKAERDEAFC